MNDRDSCNNYALLIGVEEYSVPPATAVDGAKNDAKTLLRQCLSMGMSPGRIWVLTSPMLEPRDLADLGYDTEGLNVGKADLQGLRCGLADFGKAFLARKPVAGLITFSGHGVEEDGLRLCPSNYEECDRINTSISVGQALRAAGLQGPVDDITVLLDCCDAGGAALRANLVVALEKFYHQAEKTKRVFPPLAVPARVIAACRRFGTSVSSTFGGQKQGAFTWAVTSVMGQWKTVYPFGVAQLTVTYEELVSRTTKLLSALSFKQEARLLGSVARLPFLQPGLTEYTTTAPDGDRPTRQVRPYLYVFRLGDASGQDLAQAIATGSSPPPGMSIKGVTTLADQTEYWYVNAPTATGTTGLLAPRQKIWVGPAQLRPIAYHEPPAAWTSSQSFTLVEDQAWVRNQALLPAGNDASLLFSGTSAEGLPIYLQLRVNNSSGLVTGIGWWQIVQQGTAAALITPDGTLSPVTSGALPTPTLSSELWGIIQPSPPP